VLVTGDPRHHVVRRAAASGLAVIDAGHAETERPFVAALPAIAGRVTGLPVLHAGIDASPWLF
jgi:putative NIF3 family GTP cyclohydrolase 1 type 2